MISKDILEKYISVGDYIEIIHGKISKGVLLEIADDAIVIRTEGGAPCIISFNTIEECKKLPTSKTNVVSMTQIINPDQLDEAKMLVISSIKDEDKNTPLSDRQLRTQLRRKLGINITKLFVKELRNSLGIPSALERANNGDVLLSSISDIPMDVVSEIKNFLKNIVENENKATPYSDLELRTKIRNEFNINVTKPFVKDLRESMGIVTQIERQDAYNVLKDESFDISSNFIPATAEVFKYFVIHNNGAAKNNDFQEIRFTDDCIVSAELKDEIISTSYWGKDASTIPVVCDVKLSHGKAYANFVCRPGTISDFKTTINRLKDEGRSELANAITAYITALGFQIDEDDPLVLYLSANRARNIQKYDVAISIYEKLIQQEYNLDAVVVELANVYEKILNKEKAITVLENNMNKLQNQVKACNILYSLYAGDREKQLALLFKMQEINTDNPKQMKVIKKRIERLRNKNIVTKSNNSILLNSPIISRDIEICKLDNYIFPDSNNLDEKYDFLKIQIKQTKQYSDLPLLYLLQLRLLFDNGNMNSAMFRESYIGYCRTKALVFFISSKKISARDYLLEGIKNTDDTNCYLLYIATFCFENDDFFKIALNNNTSYEDFFKNIKINITYEFLTHFARICTLTTKGRKMVKPFLLQYWDDACKELEIEYGDPNIIINALQALSDDELEKDNKIESVLSKILYTDEIETRKQLLHQMDSGLLSETDKTVLYKLRKTVDVEIDFLRKHSYDDKFDQSQILIDRCRESISEIDESPTKLGRKYFIPILQKIEYSMEEKLKKLKQESIPVITIQSLGLAVLKNEEYYLQIGVHNEENCSKVLSGELCINAVNGQLLSDNLVQLFSDSISGGRTLPFEFAISNSLISKDATQIVVDCSLIYIDIDKKERSQSKKVSFNIQEFDSSFIAFRNPYAAAAIVEDENLFKGREQEIAEICEYVQVPRRGYILYGQKRSGKSSILWHVAKKLQDKGNIFSVYFSLGEQMADNLDDDRMMKANLYFTILKQIENKIKRINKDVFKQKIGKLLRFNDILDECDEIFRFYLEIYRDIIHYDLGFKSDHIVLVIDEFTYLYYLILQGQLSPNIMHLWKALIEGGYFSMVWAGQDAMPRFMEEYANDFAIMKTKELTYISVDAAKELIEKPIWDTENDKSRFSEDAVNEIIRLTACSPFYIQHICSDMVNYANSQKRLPITLFDVRYVTDININDRGSFTRMDFDNLITCGDAKLDVVPPTLSYKVLRDISIVSHNVEYIDVKDVPGYENDKSVAQVIKEMLRRKVLIRKSNMGERTLVKIQVELFKEWIFNHAN